MANTHENDLVVQLEESLSLSSLDQGPKLVDAVIAEKMPNREAIKNILRTAWQEYGEAKIIWVKDNLFAITVTDEDMAGKILDNGPWSVMKQCFSVKRWPVELAIEEIDTAMVPYWVQIREVPLNFYSEENIKKMGRKIGEVVQYESPNHARGFLRVRIMVNTRNPLVQGFWLARMEGKETWVEFQYERLADMCYRCGRIGHSNNDCRFEPASDGATSYVTWTRAKIIRETFKQPKRMALPLGERRKAGAVRNHAVLYERRRVLVMSGEGRGTDQVENDRVDVQYTDGRSHNTRNIDVTQGGHIRYRSNMTGSEGDLSRKLITS
ncbi:hypothetical protein CerSpe_173320 [Prunus speciosa]